MNSELKWHPEKINIYPGQKYDPMDKTLIATYTDLYSNEELKIILRNLIDELDVLSTTVFNGSGEYRKNLESIVFNLIAVKLNIK